MRTYNLTTSFSKPKLSSGTNLRGSEALERRFESLVQFLKQYDLAAEASNERSSTKLLETARKSEVREQLRQAGLYGFELRRRECRTLYRYLHKSEQVFAAIGGWSPHGGYALLAATSHRIIYLRQQLLFTAIDEIAYEMVGALSISSSRWYASVTVHARTGDYRLEYVNHIAAQTFVDFVERKSIDSAAIRTIPTTASP